MKPRRGAQLAEAGIHYQGRTDLLVAIMDEGTTAAGVLGNQILDLMNIAGTFGGYLLRAVTFAVSLGVDMLVIAFLVARRRFIDGITMTGVK